MRSRGLLYIFLLLFVVAFLIWRNVNHYDKYDVGNFRRKGVLLEYTKHARCRMECRHITPEEIREIMDEGSVNYNKSQLGANPCPTFALEGYTNEHQHLRVVFAQCASKTKVVTCIDLEKEWQCDCPGDERKY